MGNPLFTVDSFNIRNERRNSQTEPHLHVVTARTSYIHRGQRFLTSAALPKRNEAYHLEMRRLHPECSDSESYDPSLPASILLREEPEDDEEDDEEEHDDGEDEDGDEGYSE
jgi:hypothetical protein